MEIKLDRLRDEPRKLPFELIKNITNNFSEELGRGTFGKVFKGVLEDGEQIAVKMLRFMPNINEQQFENEYEILKRLEHPNIVRLVGFCDETEKELVEYNGKLTICHTIHRALCLEYMPNGSLGKLLSVAGDNLGNNWPIRYKIIKGICKGLKYLQEGLEFPIFHLDLKPDNILLDEKMMPKISDFGLSRLIGEGNTINTLSHLGTIGYLPPEFINYQVISKEYDIYSLGVIITKIIVTGITGYSDVADMDAQEFVEHVHENWKRCLQETPKYESLEVHCKQVKRCIEIARNCMEADRYKRPTIKDIVSQLDEMGSLEIDSKPPMEKGLPRTTQQKRTKLYNDPPPEISHRAHPEHKLKLMTSAAPYFCDGCKELGYGVRYTRDCGGGHSIHLHTRCALADDTLVHPLFGYGKMEFRLLLEPPSPVQDRVCDGCGEPTLGYVYHCFEHDLDIHPGCATLPERIVHDGRALELRGKASRDSPPCDFCGDNKGRRSRFWAYRYHRHLDGKAVDVHVACFKEMARRSFEATYRHQDVGDGAQASYPYIYGMLDYVIRSMESTNTRLELERFERYGNIALVVASVVFSLVFRTQQWP